MSNTAAFTRRARFLASSINSSTNFVRIIKYVWRQKEKVVKESKSDEISDSYAWKDVSKSSLFLDAFLFRSTPETMSRSISSFNRQIFACVKWEMRIVTVVLFGRMRKCIRITKKKENEIAKGLPVVTTKSMLIRALCSALEELVKFV